MKINRLEAHDRLLHFKKDQSDNISMMCQKIIDERPFGANPFYIFAHARTAEDGVTKKLIWQPRLTKPLAQENSMLFKAYPGTDTVKVIWMIPAREIWGSFEKGKLTENSLISQSIEMFRRDAKRLEAKEDDDLTDAQINKIYEEISRSLGYRTVTQ